MPQNQRNPSAVKDLKRLDAYFKCGGKLKQNSKEGGIHTRYQVQISQLIPA